MKTTSWVIQVFLVVGLVLSSNSAFAARAKSKSVTPQTEASQSDLVTHSSSMESSPSISRFGLGLSTLNVGGSSTSASLWMDLSGAQSVQLFFAIGSTSPFQAGLGGIFRHTLNGTRAQGLHVGAGASVGSVAGGNGSAFAFNVGPVAGFHFGLPGLNDIQLSLDGGATLSVVDGEANFGVGALSSALGLSVHYFW